MSITLHNDLPLPKRGSARTAKYPFDSLTQPGQCFIENDVLVVSKAVGRLTAAAGNYRRKMGADAPKFSIRVTQVDGKDAVGVWRV